MSNILKNEFEFIQYEKSFCNIKIVISQIYFLYVGSCLNIIF